MEQGAGGSAVMATVNIMLDTQERFMYTLAWCIAGAPFNAKSELFVPEWVWVAAGDPSPEF